MNKKLIHKIFGIFFLITGLLLLLMKLSVIDVHTYDLDGYEMTSQMILSIIILSGIYNLYKGFWENEEE